MHKESSGYKTQGRTGWFTTGEILQITFFTLRNIMEQSNEWQTPLVMNFVDFKKAFDGINKDLIWNIFKNH